MDYFFPFFPEEDLSETSLLGSAPVFDSMPVLTKGGNAEFPLIDVYSFSNELISQHNVIGFRGPLHIYDGKLLNIYNPNEIS